MKSIKLIVKHEIHTYALHQVDEHVLGSYDIRCQFKGFCKIFQALSIYKGII